MKSLVRNLTTGLYWTTLITFIICALLCIFAVMIDHNNEFYFTYSWEEVGIRKGIQYLSLLELFINAYLRIFLVITVPIVLFIIINYFFNKLKVK